MSIKKWLACVMVVLLLGATGASAMEMVGTEEYAEIFSTVTQDSVIDMTADQDCTVMLGEPDETDMALLESIYDFVWHDKNRPVRYYDEPTQQKIQALVPEVDIDVLHMTEFMVKELEGMPEEAVEIQQLLDVEYRPGQLVVVTLGVLQEDGEYLWFPYRAEVPELGLITYRIPREDFEYLTGREVIYLVLTDRVGARGGVVERTEIVEEPQVIPSKSARDIAEIHSKFSKDGAALEDDFDIYLVDLTQPMQDEVKRMEEFLAEEEADNAIIDWFGEEAIKQAKLLLPDVNIREMLVYDIVAVMSKDYKDAYGDVVTENMFAAAYDPDCGMVCMLGFPIAGAQEEPYMEWYCLRTEVVDRGYVEIVFRQLVIPRMQEESAMLVVLSEPIVAEEEEAEVGDKQ